MLSTKVFGHPKSRHKILKNVIPVQRLTFYGETLEQAAMATLVSEAIQGRGPLAKSLKAEAKDLAEKFVKGNPEYKFSRFGRKRTGEVEAAEAAKATKKAASKSPAKKTRAKKELVTA